MFVYQRVLLVAEAWIPVPLPSKQLRHIDRPTEYNWLTWNQIVPNQLLQYMQTCMTPCFLYIYILYIYIAYTITSLRLSKVSYGQITIFIAYIS